MTYLRLSYLQCFGVLRIVHVNPTAQEIALDVLWLELEEAPWPFANKRDDTHGESLLL